MNTVKGFCHIFVSCYKVTLEEVSNINGTNNEKIC